MFLFRYSSRVTGLYERVGWRQILKKSYDWLNWQEHLHQLEGEAGLNTVHLPISTIDPY